MEAIFGILIFIFVGFAILALVFLICFQPLWGILDVATSREHSSGTKVAVILLTLLLLGPIMTFFYALVGSRSPALKKCTIMALLTLLVSVPAAFGLSVVQPMANDRLVGIFSDETSKSEEPAEAPAAESGARSAPEAQESRIGEAVAESFDRAPFKAVLYVPVDEQKWSVSVAGFTLSGPVDGSVLPVTVPSIYPLNQIAIDESGPVIYGITTHQVGKIVPTTGHFVELEIDPALPEISWPAAIAFDAKNRKLVVTGRSGAYTYDPGTGEWRQPTGFRGLNLVSMSYDEGEHAFYGLVSLPGRDEIDRIVKLSDTGAVVSTIKLSDPLSISEIPSGRLQLIKAGEVLVILRSAHYSQSGPGHGQFVERGTYLVNPETGQVQRIRKGN